MGTGLALRVPVCSAEHVRLSDSDATAVPEGLALREMLPELELVSVGAVVREQVREPVEQEAVGVRVNVGEGVGGPVTVAVKVAV